MIPLEDRKRVEEFRLLYPQYNQEEMEEAFYNFERYIKALYNIALRLHEEGRLYEVLEQGRREQEAEELDELP